VLTVSVVMFMAITLWVVSNSRSSTDARVDLSGDWRVRWAQVPGPAEVYVQNSEKAIMEGDLEGAAVWLSKALALDPNLDDAWVKMGCVSVVHGGSYTLDDRGLHRLLDEPLDGAVLLADWEGVRSLLAVHPERSMVWLTDCAGVVLLNYPPETPPETLDTKVATP
jgi:hypothetical protein